MSQRLTGKVAVVTGASKGIGASIARHLAAEGAAVVVNYASSKEGAERVVAEITGEGGRAVAVRADVAKPADIRRLFAEAQQAFGRLDVLVNNAGIYKFAPLEDVTAEHFHKMFDLNVLGLILASQEAARHFGPAGGSIINISSVVATAAPPNASVYSATKAAVDAVTRYPSTIGGPARAIGFCLGLAGCTRAPREAPATAPTPVTVSYPVERDVTDYADFTGRTAAVDSVEVRARVWGYLDKVHFKEGALVKAGDVLFEIDPRTYRAALAQAEGNLASMQSRVRRLDADLTRAQRAVELRALAPEDYDKVVGDRGEAAASVEALRAAVQQAKLDLEYTKV